MDEYGNDIITVSDDDGKEYEFEVLDRIETEEGARYVALTPYYENEADYLEDDGELIILRVIDSEDDESATLEHIEDEDEFDEIAAIFEDRLAELFGDDTDE